MTRRERFVLGGILAVALAARVAWCFYAARLPAGGLHDPNFYYLYAEQLANGHGMFRLLDHQPSAYYPPGYVLSLWPFMWLAFHSPLDGFRHVEVGVVATLNIVWQLLTIALAFAIARRITRSSVAGYVAAGVLALWPNLIFHTAVALTESLFLFLLLAGLLPLVRPPAEWTIRRLVISGVVLGAATLVRPVTVPVFPALLVVLLVAKVGWRRAVRDTAIVTACAVAVLVPWMLRNAVVMNSFTLSTNTGDNLCMSRRVGGSGGFEFPNPRCDPPRFDSLTRPEFETKRDAYARKVAIDFIKDHPGEEFRLIFRRLGATFPNDADGLRAVESYDDDPFMSAGTRDVLRTAATTYAFIAALGAVAGVVVLAARKRSPETVLILLTGAGMLIPPMVFFGDPRFHVPAVPIAAIAVGALAVGARYRSDGSESS